MMIDEAVALVKIERECVIRADICDRKCEKCDLLQDSTKLTDMYEQLAEWLEELKSYREIGTVEECKGCVLQILEAYIKGIDDFVEKLLEKAPRNYVGDLELGGSVSFLSANTVIKIAEQMKVGVSGERD